MRALFDIESWPVTTASAGWLSQAGDRDTIGPADRPFALASVTKPLFAYAVLIAVEEGSLRLDQPAGPAGSTIAHLLAHASGLGDDPSSPLGPVGSRRIYSNAGFEVLGMELETATGLRATEYVDEAIVQPLGMTATALDGSPAHGARSSVDDLLTLLSEWLAPTLIAPETMKTATTAWLPALPGVLPGYGRQDPNPWGLGFELRGHKSPHWTGSTNSPATFGHFGRAGTFLWVDPLGPAGHADPVNPADLFSPAGTGELLGSGPSSGVACVGLTDRDFGPWAVTAWPRLADSVLTEAADRQFR